MKKRNTSEVSRFAATLLFQFRVMVRGKPNVMRTCEKRMVIFTAASASAALAAAKRRGKTAEHSYKNNVGNPVHFEFVGVLDLLGLGVECEDDEVWYDIITLKRPKERAKTILPPERKLDAMRWQGANKPLNARPRVKHAAH